MSGKSKRGTFKEPMLLPIVNENELLIVMGAIEAFRKYAEKRNDETALDTLAPLMFRVLQNLPPELIEGMQFTHAPGKDAKDAIEELGVKMDRLDKSVH